MTAYLAEFRYEIRIHCRLSTAKADAATRGLEIEIIDLYCSYKSLGVSSIMFFRGVVPSAS